MVDINEVFPNAIQAIRIDLLDDCNNLFQFLVKGFNRQKETSVSQDALLIRELNNLDIKIIFKSSPDIICYEGIYFSSLYLYGWDLAIAGDFEISNDIYKNQPGIVEPIEIKFDTIEPPQQFFENFTEATVKAVINGMAHAKYYYWLKEQQESRSLYKDTKSTGGNNFLQDIGKNKIKHQNSLSNYLNHPDPLKLIEGLKPLFLGAKGKEAAIIILALHKLQLLVFLDGKRNELYRVINKEFGSIGSPSGINIYLSSYRLGNGLNNKAIITDSEIERYCNIIKKI
jgi:hypothetical protein